MATFLSTVVPILEKSPGIKKSGANFTIDENIDAVFFVLMGKDVLQIPRVIRLETAGELITIQTAKSEHYYLPADQVVGVKLGGKESKFGRSSAGFVSA